MALRFYLLRAIATLKITNCLKHLVPFVLGFASYCFVDQLFLLACLLLHTTCFCQFTATCLLTKACESQIFYWLA